MGLIDSTNNHDDILGQFLMTLCSNGFMPSKENIKVNHGSGDFFFFFFFLEYVPHQLKCICIHSFSDQRFACWI